MRKRVLLFSFVLSLGSVGFASTFKIDQSHSSVSFKVRHILGKVTGRFEKFEGTFDYDKNNLKTFKSSAIVVLSSINTDVEKRDEHLRSADFFDVTKYPTLTFVSKGLTDIKGDKAKLKGDLTLHGVTKPVILDVEFLGQAKDPWGNERASVSARTIIKRADFGLTWNQVLETGQVLVGEEVEIELEIEGIKI